MPFYFTLFSISNLNFKFFRNTRLDLEVLEKTESKIQDQIYNEGKELFEEREHLLDEKKSLDVRKKKKKKKKKKKRVKLRNCKKG